MKKHTLTAVTAAFIGSTLAIPAFAQNINLAVPTAPQAPILTKVLTPWAKKVSHEAGEDLNIAVRPGRTLASPLNVYDRVIADVAQIGWGVQELMGGKFRRSGVAQLPFEADNAEEASVALWRLYEKGITKMEYDEVKPLSIIVFPPNAVHTKNKPIKSLEDLKGLKIATGGRIAANTIKPTGAAPISLSLTAMYQGLNRGTVDGNVMVWTAFLPFKLFEVTRHHYEIPLGSGTAMVFMSNKAYDGLTTKARRVVDANSGAKFSHRMGKFWDGSAKFARAKISKMPGHVITTASQEVAAAWKEKMKPVVTQWVKEAPDGERVLAAFRAEIAAFRKSK